MEASAKVDEKLEVLGLRLVHASKLPNKSTQEIREIFMSKRDFTMVNRSIWRSKRFLGLGSEARVVHLYFLTCEHVSSAGCFRIPSAYAAADLGWDVARYLQARSEVAAAGLIAADDNTDEVYIDRWFKHCPPTNEKHTSGTRKLICDIESDSLRSRAEADFDEAYLLWQHARRQQNGTAGVGNVSNLHDRTSGFRK